MNRVITSLILFLVVVFFPLMVAAQSTPPIPSTSAFAIPGVNCGNAQSTDPTIQKCCYNAPLDQNQQIRKTNIPIVSSIPIAGWILEGVVNFVTSEIESQFRKSFPAAFQLQRQVTLSPCVNGEPSTPGDPGNSACMCKPAKDNPLLALETLCKNVNDKERDRCIDCVKGTNVSGLNKKNTVGVWTGVGCVRANATGFITETLLGWGIGLAGFIALLCIIYSAFILQTSQGNPEQIKKAQENLTSCVMGLLLIIFSVFILRLIGVDILRIPGFG